MTCVNQAHLSKRLNDFNAYKNILTQYNTGFHSLDILRSLKQKTHITLKKLIKKNQIFLFKCLNRIKKLKCLTNIRENVFGEGIYWDFKHPI
ncbi:MAG: hypothetical protein VXX85_06180 [Candidatus Margulisiibacteriota bacterium]|nr:hypothetical protein [Candidatus Margulisiibacteriota bacterium]